MKKKLLALFAMLFVCTMLSFGLTACKNDNTSESTASDTAPAHEHTYNQQVAEEKYLKSAATCTAKAVYYCSCLCGAVGTTMFEYGETTDHTYNRQIAEEKYLKSEATCTEKAVYYYSCSCGAVGTTTFEYGETIAHTYNQQVVEEKYLKSAATCTAEAVYYCSCLCGAIGTTTFEYGETTAHPAESEWSYNETHHWHNSTCACNVNVDYAEHTTDGSGWCSVCQQAILPTDGVLYDVSADGTYAEVIAYLGEYSKVKISDTYNNLPVRSIYNGAFKNTTITTVFIPDSVTSIGASAFYGCSELTSITIPDRVTSIGRATFEGCTSLKSVTIPDSVTSIASSAFSGCSNLQYNVYSYIKYLGNASNPYYALITTFNSNLSSYQIHNETKLICDSAFMSCTRLKNITIPSSVTSIGELAFFNCSGLTSLTIPDSVTFIGDSAFDNCDSLTEITLPFACDHFVTVFGYSTRSSLKSVTITSATFIGNYAFYKCSGLTSITIPDSVTSIDRSAFYGCRGLTSIVFKGTIAEWNVILKGEYWNYNTGNYTVQCTDGVINK